MRVVINQGIDGLFEIVTDGPCEVFVVNDHCHGDRVYKLGACHTVGADLVDLQLGDSDIGSATDDREFFDVEHALRRHAPPLLNRLACNSKGFGKRLGTARALDSCL